MTKQEAIALLEGNMPWRNNEQYKIAVECIEKCEQFEYVTRLNRQYIDRVKNSGLGKNKSIEYIEKHLVESTRSLIDWGDNE